MSNLPASLQELQATNFIFSTVNIKFTNLRQSRVLLGGGLLWDDFPATTTLLRQNEFTGPVWVQDDSTTPPLLSVAH